MPGASHAAVAAPRVMSLANGLLRLFRQPRSSPAFIDQRDFTYYKVGYAKVGTQDPYEPERPVIYGPFVPVGFTDLNAQCSIDVLVTLFSSCHCRVGSWGAVFCLPLPHF